MNYVSTSGALYLGLKALGHDVDFRPPVFGEDLSSYDLAVVCVACLDRRGTYHHEKCAWVLEQMEDRVILYFDDWATGNFHKDTNYRLNRITDKYLKWRGYADQPKNVLACMFKQLNRIVGLDWTRKGNVTENNRGCPWPILTPHFEFGDPKLVLGALKTFDHLVIDPTSLCDLPPIPTPAKTKRRAWTHATLQNHEPWLNKQKLAWPIERFGNQRVGDGFMDEDALLHVYDRNFGVTQPLYPISGSGWWRIRAYYSAKLLNVLLVSPGDAISELTAHYSHPGTAIEQFSERELNHVAQEQSLALLDRVWPRSRALDALGSYCLSFGRRTR